MGLRFISRAMIETMFSDHVIRYDTPMGEHGPHTVKGISIFKLKNVLRGHVYQDQRKFLTQMKEMGLYCDWCDDINAYIIHGDTKFHPKYDAHLPWAHKPL